MKKRLCLVLFLLVIGCKEGGGGSGSGSIDLSVSTETPDASQFDVWTLKATVTQSNCPDISVGKTIEEEYQIVQAAAGCRLSDEDASGNFLTNSEQLVDDETAVCKAGGKTVTISDQKATTLGSQGEGVAVSPPVDFVLEAAKGVAKGENCSIHGAAAARLELGSNDQLSGGIGYTLNTEGQCGALKDCEISGTVVGRRGRHAPQGRNVVPAMPASEGSGTKPEAEPPPKIPTPLPN